MLVSKASEQRRAAMEIALICFSLRCGAACNRLQFLREQIHLEGNDDALRYLVLQGENVAKVSVIPLRPEVAAGRAVDELHIDPDPIRRLANAPLKEISHVQPLSDLRDLHRLAFVGEG